MNRRIAVAAAAVVLFSATSALAVPQSKTQQKCINSLNKGMAKISGLQNKGNAKCVKTRAKDGTTNIFVCLGVNPKVDKAVQKNCDQESALCTMAPDFGRTSCSTVNFEAQFEPNELLQDIFPDSSNVTACSSDKAGCKCQGKTFKATIKLYKTHAKSFNKCKKSGLKDKTAPFDDAADLATCIGSDPKNKIDKAETKLEGAITKSCAGVASPLPAGDCAALNGTALSDCLEERVRCHTCLMATISDSLPLDCDLYDDGNTENGSCFNDS